MNLKSFKISHLLFKEIFTLIKTFKTKFQLLNGLIEMLKRIKFTQKIIDKRKKKN